MALYETALSIINDAAVDLGIATSVTDAYGSTDPNIVQLRNLLKNVGRRLCLAREWKHLVKEHSFTTTSATSYDLPADFSSMVEQSSWNRTSNMRGVPLGAQAWQYLKANESDVAWTVFFRAYDTTLVLHPDPPAAGEVIAFEYLSRYWVTASGSSAPDKDAPTANTDTIEFDATLMVPALKLAFLKAKGFTEQAAMMKAEFDEAFERVAGANTSAAPVLSLGLDSVGERYLSESNAPSTGFGLEGDGGLF